MSAGAAIPFREASAIAVDLLRLLEPVCARVQVAGSLRRHKPEVHDIEIVAIPRIERETVPALFDEHADLVDHDRLAEALTRLRIEGELVARDVEVHRADGTVETQHRLGSAYQALVFRRLPVDLFITTPDQWGCILALRTGPHDWNIEIVTRVQRYLRKVEGGRVLHLGKPVPEPTLRTRALERAYPLAKQLAEVLELEAIEPMATSAKHIRQAIGAELAEIGATAGKGDIVADGAPCQPFTEPVDMYERTDPLHPAEEAALLRQALRREDEGPEADDGR